MHTKSLEAMNELVRSDTDPGLWEAMGDDPQFQVDIGTGLVPGWYLLDLELHSEDEASMEAALYANHGEGCTEHDAIRLPMVAKGVCARRFLLRFDRAVAQLRLDPDIKPGRFRVKQFSLREIGRAHALVHMMAQVLSGLPRAEKQQQLQQFWQILRRDGKGALGLCLYRQMCARRDGTPDQGYAQWLMQYDRRGAQAAELAALKFRPLFSIVMPTYNADVTWLRACVESVRAQAYPDWELCIADDASTSPAALEYLKTLPALDARIKVVFRPSNGHISVASNTALALARGEYIALLDHDDELHPRALLEVAKALNDKPELKALYSDEDKMDLQGLRSDPYFKPGWDRQLILGQNFFSHLGVYQTELVRQVGGFRKGFEGSQDHDLILRCIEHLRDDEIGHIPKVLYHWRMVPGSTSVSLGEKSYAAQAGRRAVQEYLERQRENARVSILESGYYRIQYALPASLPKISLIVPTRDKAELLRLSIRSILDKTRYPDYEIIVVDNGSIEPETRALFAELQQDARVRVLSYPYPFNYSAINNFAVRHARGNVLGLVNNDIEVISPDWLEEMLAYACKPKIGAVGCMLLYPDEHIQHAGVLIGLHGVAGHPYSRMPRHFGGQMGRALLVQRFSAVTAACLLVRREVYERVGGLDEGLKVAFNDVDFCLRVQQAGYRNVWTPHAVMYHHESATRGADDNPEKKARMSSEIAFMQARWGDALLQDGSYNPNLTLVGEPFSLAFPPRGCAVRVR